MSIIDETKKSGYSVGVRLVVTDANGKVSETDSEWHGFNRNQANDLAMEITGAVVGIAEKRKSEYEQ